MKKVTDLKENEGILCLTEEEATAIHKLCGTESHYHKYKGNYVVYPFDGSFSDLSYCKEEKYIYYPASDFLTPTYTVTRKQLLMLAEKYPAYKEDLEIFADNEIPILQNKKVIDKDRVSYLYDEAKKQGKIELGMHKLIFPNYEKPKQKKEITVWVNVYESGNLKGIYQTEEVAEHNDASKQCKTVEGKLTYEI